jgi:hypothetical protein
MIDRATFRFEDVQVTLINCGTAEHLGGGGDILQKYSEVLDWIQQAQGIVHCRAVTNTGP